MKKLIVVMMLFMMSATSFAKTVYMKAGKDNNVKIYHLYKNCRHLKKSKVIKKMSLKQAKRQGKRVCKVCTKR